MVNLRTLFNYFSRHNDCYYVNEIFLSIKRSDLKKSNQTLIHYCFILVKFWIYILIFGVLFLLFIPLKNKFNYEKAIAIARVSSEEYKLKKLFKGIQIFKDDIKNRDFSVFKIGSIKYKFNFLFKSYIKSCFSHFYQINSLLKNKQLVQFRFHFLNYYIARIPHTVIHESSLNFIMSKYKFNTIYTGANVERFGLIAARLAKKYKKTIICIPHGIETLDKVPAGYVGDLFYSTSSEMALKLNILYKTRKFNFDEKINKVLYHLEFIPSQNEEIYQNRKKIVFFTHPTHKISLKEPIIQLAKYLKTIDKKLYIKVHPRENSKHYVLDNCIIINDLKSAILGNICISLNSTVLLEAVYNNSTVISLINILKDEEFGGDIDNLVHLNDKRIYKPNSLENVFSIINTELAKKL
jgi:hypothetical protein